jgi:hypothetical protein
MSKAQSQSCLAQQLFDVLRWAAQHSPITAHDDGRIATMLGCRNTPAATASPRKRCTDRAPANCPDKMSFAATIRSRK